jgi:hypothetical protein
MKQKTAKIIKMSSNRVTTKELQTEIEVIKNNHLTHIMEDIDELKEDVKDNRRFFTERLDRLDNRIYWTLGIVVTTLLTFVGALLSRVM